MRVGFRKLNDISKKYKSLLLADIQNKKIKLEEATSCICCTSANLEKLLDVDRFDLPFGSYICKDCGLVITSPRIQQESLPYYYEKYYHPLNYGKESLEHQVALFKECQGKKIYRKLQLHISNKPELDVLEIGAGVGSVLDEFREEASKEKIKVNLLGTEYSAECIEQCKRRNIIAIEGNAETVLTQNRKFDIIILSHVFEHFIDLENELNVLKKLLKDDGLLYIEVPGLLDNHDKAYYDFSFLGYSVHAHMYNFTLVTLRNIVEKYGFILEEGNEKVETIFHLGKNNHVNIKNDTERIGHYLEFLEQNQSFALSQKEQIEIRDKELARQKEQIETRDKELARQKEQIETRDKELGRPKEQIETREKELTRQKEQIETRDKELARQKERIETRDKELARQKERIETRDKELAKARASVVSIKALIHPIEKYKAYKNLLKVLNDSTR